MKNKYRVITFDPAQRSGFDAVRIYENCADVENEGPVLYFRDLTDGIFRKTTLAWEVQIIPPATPEQTGGAQ